VPKFERPADVLAYKQRMTARQHVRVPQYREIVDRRQKALDAVRTVLAPDYQKTWVPYQTDAPARALYDLTNIMASNEREIRYKARTTDPAKIAAVQRHEAGHEALDAQLFPMPTLRRMYSFLADSYTIVALDIVPKPGALAGYADREELESYAEDAGEPDEADDSPKARYKRAYARSKGQTSREKHEDAYDAVTTDALLEDGASVRVRVIDPLTFKGWQTDGDPSQFAEGIEYGRKRLNPLLLTLEGYGVREENGTLYIAGPRNRRMKSQSYKALGVDMIADVQSDPMAGGSGPQDEYVDYIQVRTCEETVIYIGHPSGKNDRQGEPGIMLRVPNVFGGQSTGYYLVEGDTKLRSGEIEDRYDPPILGVINEAQHFNIIRSVFEAMMLVEGTRPPYQLAETAAQASVDPYDATQQTKSIQPEDSQTVAVAEGEVKRVEGLGLRLEPLFQLTAEALRLSEPTDLWGGTGASSETGIAIARRMTALLTKLVPYQANIATVCKLIHQDVDRYVRASGETIKLSYIAPGSARHAKPEIREITPETAALPMDLDYIVGSETPESKYAAEQMSERRLQLRVIGKRDHMEEIGIKDPTATEQRMWEDMAVEGAMPPVVEAMAALFAQYGKAALQRELGPLAAAPGAGAGGAPVILGPDGRPMARPPANVAPPTQTVPAAAGAEGVQVTPGATQAVA